jgi:hypothetical protein
MYKSILTCGLAALLLGCSSNNTSPGGLQYSIEMEAFPHNYQVEAARVVQERDADPGFARVSKPRTTSGATALGPERWYSCVRGIPSPAPSNSFFAAVSKLIRSWFSSEDPAGVYDVVLFFSQEKQSSLTEGFDLPLCRNVEFEFITADPPLPEVGMSAN